MPVFNEALETDLGIARSDNALLDVWDERGIDWRATRAHRIVCPECCRHYPEMTWNTDTTSAPYLVCECGECFRLTVNRDR